MKFSRSIQAIDSHTMGEPTRIVTGGIPNIKGKTMAEKKSLLRKQSRPFKNCYNARAKRT